MMKFQRVDDKGFYEYYMPIFWIMLAVSSAAAGGLYWLSQGGFASLGMWGPSAALSLGVLAIAGFFFLPLGIVVHGPDTRRRDSKWATAEAVAAVMSKRYGGEFTSATVKTLLGERRLYTLTDGLDEEEAKEDWYGPLAPVTFGNTTKNLRLANRKGQWILVDVTGLPNDRLWDAPEAELSTARA